MFTRRRVHSVLAFALTAILLVLYLDACASEDSGTRGEVSVGRTFTQTAGPGVPGDHNCTHNATAIVSSDQQGRRVTLPTPGARSLLDEVASEGQPDWNPNPQRREGSGRYPSTLNVRSRLLSVCVSRT